MKKSISSALEMLVQWAKGGHRIQITLNPESDGTLSIHAKSDSHPDHPDWTSGFFYSEKLFTPSGEEFAEKLFRAVNPPDPFHGRSNMDARFDLCPHLEHVLSEHSAHHLEAYLLIERDSSTAYHGVGLVLHNNTNSGLNASFQTGNMALQGSGGGMNVMDMVMKCLKKHDIRYEFVVMDNDKLSALLKNPTRLNTYLSSYGTFLENIDENYPSWDYDWLEIKQNAQKLSMMKIS